MPYIELEESGESNGKQYLKMRVADLQNEAIDYAIFIVKDATGDMSGQLGNGLEHYSDSVTWTGLAENTAYSFTALVTPNGSYERSYSATFTTGSNTPPAPIRPSNFEWTTTKGSGYNFSVLATEWNGLLDKINEFRAYKGLSQITTFMYASSGGDFLATMCNQSINIINTLSPSINPPSLKYSGDTIYASDIHLLRNSLNSVT